MKIIKKLITLLTSAVILCSCFSFFPVNAANQYVYGDQATIFDLIVIRRSIINEDGNYQMSDYQRMSNFLLKKKSEVVNKVLISYDTEGCDTSSYIDSSVLDSVECESGILIEIPQAALIKEGYIHAGWYYDGKVYSPGAYFTVPDNDVIFTPYWY